MYIVENKILEKIRKAKRGSLFFVDSFAAYGNAKAVQKALERLVEKQELMRVAAGIYTRPRISKVLGPIKPGLEEVAAAMAKRDKARILPTGAYALNALGLSTQVPTKVVYLTDGSARNVKLGKQTMVFKRAAPKNFGAYSQVCAMAIQALKSIGKEKVTQEHEQKIIRLLEKEKTHYLEHDMVLAPEWIRKVFRKALKFQANEL